MNHETPLERFRKACGLGAPMTLSYRSARSPAEEPSTFDAPWPFVRIGRSPKNELTLTDGQVSRRHAYLQAVGGRVVGIDLKSRTQTSWGDPPEPRPWGWLDPAVAMQIGPYRIERTDRPPEGGLSDVPLSFRPDGGRGIGRGFDPAICVRAALPGGRGRVTWEIPGLLALVGREDHCQLVLDDESISRMHACLVRTPMGTWVVDLERGRACMLTGPECTGPGWRTGTWSGSAASRWWSDTIAGPRASIATPCLWRPGRARRSRPATSPDRATSGHPAGKGWDWPSGPPRPPRPMKAPVPPPPLRSAEPAPLDQGDWEPVPGSGPSPYALWQQQMQLMESFHNDMTMMVQMFIAMHREFQDSVRDELERVQKLTRELSRLNARLLQASESRRPARLGRQSVRRRESGRSPGRPGRHRKRSLLPARPLRSLRRPDRSPRIGATSGASAIAGRRSSAMPPLQVARCRAGRARRCTPRSPDGSQRSSGNAADTGSVSSRPSTANRPGGPDAGTHGAKNLGWQD